MKQKQGNVNSVDDNNNNSIQFFIYLHAELNSQWPITGSAQSIKQTINKQNKKTQKDKIKMIKLDFLNLSIGY
jgi:hypothetical protein